MSSTTKAPKTVNATEFKQLVAEGNTVPQLMDIYGLKKDNILAIAKELEVKVKRNVTPVFVLVRDDIPQENVSATYSSDPMIEEAIPVDELEEIFPEEELVNPEAQEDTDFNF